jgi:signal transduction histidine kinase
LVGVAVPPRGVRLPVALVGAGGAAAAGTAATRIGSLGGGVGLLGLLAVAAALETLPARAIGGREGTTSFSTVFVAAAASRYGWGASCLVGTGAMTGAMIVTRPAAYKALFNIAMFALAGAAAGVVSGSVPPGWRIGIFAAYAAWLVDVGLLSWVTARAGGGRFLAVSYDLYRATVWPATVIASIAAVVVRLWAESPAWALLIVPPLFLLTVYQRRLAGEEERRAALERMRDEFVATASHELRTPLTSIYGMAVTLRERGAAMPSDARKNLLDIICAEAERLVVLVENLLTTQSLPALLTGARVRPVAPLAVLSDVVAAARERAPDGVAYAIREDGGGSRVLADPDLLHRIVRNLVDNATKYSPHGGLVELSAQRRREEIVFSISDHGIGIPEADRERVFERFHRLDPDQTGGVGGSGLGLHISRQLVEGMGGRIWVADANAGTTMCFTLPAAPEETEDVERRPGAGW